MQQALGSRRSFVLSALAVVGGSSLAGCGEAEKDVTVTKQVDPMQQAKDSMDYYKNNRLKKTAKK